MKINTHASNVNDYFYWMAYDQLYESISKKVDILTHRLQQNQINLKWTIFIVNIGDA